MKLAGLLVIGSVLLATPARADDATLEPWIGTWSGKASSKGCVDPAPKKLTFDVSIGADGKLHSDGDVIFDGWGDLGWKLDAKKKGLEVVRDGMTGSLTLSKKTLKVSLRTNGACSVTATLKRATSGIASCDRVRALATIKSQCQSLPADTRAQSLADVVAAWSGWSKLKGKKKTAQGKVCTEQTTTLETEIGGCARIGGYFTGVLECDRYLELLERYYPCNGYTPETTKQQIDQMIEYWKQDPSQLSTSSCSQWITSVESMMTQCTP